MWRKNAKAEGKAENDGWLLPRECVGHPIDARVRLDLLAHACTIACILNSMQAEPNASVDARTHLHAG